ncbi:hypothetical protein V1508DRAFT_296057 [Lipomyces doorenjongii]|uniref:uncharacterized protein n=1 Tax=Lipomyces doorenjongii TaxID=383834 RepID=UPI0034CDBB53
MASSSKTYLDISHYLDLSHSYRHRHRSEVSSNPRFEPAAIDRILATLEKEVEDVRQYIRQFQESGDNFDEYAAQIRSIAASKQYLHVNGPVSSTPASLAKLSPEDEIILQEIVTARPLSRIQASSDFTIKYLDDAIKQAKSEVVKEEALRDELVTLSKLLLARLALLHKKLDHQKYSASSDAWISARTEKYVTNLLARRDKSRTTLRHLMSVLKNLLDSRVAKLLVEEENGAPVGGFGETQANPKKGASLDDIWTGTRRAKVAREAKILVENMLNAAFDADSSGWVELEDPDSIVVRLLIRSEIAVVRPGDARFIKLREFARKF